MTATVTATTRVVFLQRILLYYNGELKQLLDFKRVHSSWEDTIDYYGDEIMIKYYNNSLLSKACFKNQSIIVKSWLPRLTIQPFNDDLTLQCFIEAVKGKSKETIDVLMEDSRMALRTVAYDRDVIYCCIVEQDLDALKRLTAGYIAHRTATELLTELLSDPSKASTDLTKQIDILCDISADTTMCYLDSFTAQGTAVRFDITNCSTPTIDALVRRGFDWRSIDYKYYNPMIIALSTKNARVVMALNRHQKDMGILLINGVIASRIDGLQLEHLVPYMRADEARNIVRYMFRSDSMLVEEKLTLIDLLMEHNREEILQLQYTFKQPFAVLVRLGKLGFDINSLRNVITPGEMNRVKRAINA